MSATPCKHSWLRQEGSDIFRCLHCHGILQPNLPWPRGTGANYGIIDPDAPPLAVASCKTHGHPTNSFVFTVDGKSVEQNTCDFCRIIWQQPIP